MAPNAKGKALGAASDQWAVSTYWSSEIRLAQSLINSDLKRRPFLQTQRQYQPKGAFHLRTVFFFFFFLTGAFLSSTGSCFWVTLGSGVEEMIASSAAESEATLSSFSGEEQAVKKDNATNAATNLISPPKLKS